MGGQAVQAVPPLEGKFKEVWDLLEQKRKGNEALISAKDVTQVATDLSVTEQYVFDTIRKFEGRGLIRRSRSGESVLLTYRTPNPLGETALEGKSELPAEKRPLKPPVKFSSGDKLRVVNTQQPTLPARPTSAPKLKLTAEEATMPLNQFVGVLEAEVLKLDEELMTLKRNLASMQNLRGQKAMLLASLKDYLP